MTISDEVLRGETADIYFERARTILSHEGIDPVATMEIFPSGSGLLCGINEALELLRQALSPESDLRGHDRGVWSLEEGAEIKQKEVVLRIRARYSAYGLYETALLGILAQLSGWATAARDVVVAAAPIPVISFGARHVHPNVAAQIEYAAVVGGCVTGATPAASKLTGKAATGTIPHAMILIMGDTVKAVEAFDRWMPADINRIALVDTFRDEAEESLRVAAVLGDRLWGIRLDTPGERGGVTPDLVKEVRARLDQAGFNHVKIVVSGGVNVHRIAQYKERSAPIDAFGVGSAISSAPPLEFTGDLKEIDGKPIAKRGRIPGITENPRLKKVL